MQKRPNGPKKINKNKINTEFNLAAPKSMEYNCAKTAERIVFDLCQSQSHAHTPEGGPLRARAEKHGSILAAI